jgi:UDP-4-amino-4,6-dideoxy-N-acetyl-beta-L-altrosamine N-acetyltransferase
MPLVCLKESDLELILLWRNAPLVRQAMYTHHIISQDEHYAWFDRIKTDPSIRYYLWLDTNGNPQGVVNFTNLDLMHRTAFWGFYACPLSSPGVGMQMELDALEKAFTEFKLLKLNCEVLESNRSVINMHKKIGFIEEGCFRQQHYDGVSRINIIRLGMLGEEWPECRKKLLARVSGLTLGLVKDD